MRTQLPSRAPLVVDALIALFTPTEAPDEPLKDLQVIDGPLISESSLANDALLVAPGTPDEPGAVATLLPQSSLGRQTYLERVEVTMSLSCYSGDTAMSERRTRAAALFAAVKARVDGAQVREDVWERLYLGPQSAWYPVQTEQGAVMAVGFTLIAEATI